MPFSVQPQLCFTIGAQCRWFVNVALFERRSIVVATSVKRQATVLLFQIKQTWKEAPIEGGQLDYMKFVQIITRGKEEE